MGLVVPQHAETNNLNSAWLRGGDSVNVWQGSSGCPTALDLPVLSVLPAELRGDLSDRISAGLAAAGTLHSTVMWTLA